VPETNAIAKGLIEIAAWPSNVFFEEKSNMPAWMTLGPETDGDLFFHWPDLQNKRTSDDMGTSQKKQL